MRAGAIGPAKATRMAPPNAASIAALLPVAETGDGWLQQCETGKAKASSAYWGPFREQSTLFFSAHTQAPNVRPARAGCTDCFRAT
jgi:hypothetical protein